MVASRGLGPAPIPYRSLNANNLTKAIRFCLQPEALTAAEKVALEMSEEAVDHGHIRDWKSGMAFAGKNFAHGMSEGFSGVFTQPYIYNGGQRQGTVGVLKGFAKGTLGMTTKVSSGMFSHITFSCKWQVVRERD